MANSNTERSHITDDMLQRVRVVLVGTTHPGNIGASARAMKAMGLTELYLVSPLTFPSAAATARAAGAHDILAKAVVHETLEAALVGCAAVYGTTARERHIGWPTSTPRDAANEIIRLASHATVAIVFGREQSGLSNDELDLCQRAIWIPTMAHFRSLNLAQAVQVLAYELHVVAHAPELEASRPVDVKAGDHLAPASELNALKVHLLQVMEVVDYHDPERPKLLDRRLGRLLNRATLLHSEVQILRGFLTAIETQLRRKRDG